MRKTKQILFTVSEAAIRENVSEKTIYYRINKGQYKTVDDSGIMKISLSELKNHKKRKRGRPSKLMDKQFEKLMNKIQKPEKHYQSFFQVYRNFRRFYKEFIKPENPDHKEFVSILDTVLNENFIKNRHSVRSELNQHRRVLKQYVWLSQTINIRVYENPNVQNFFEYALRDTEIQSEDCKLVNIYIRYANTLKTNFPNLYDAVEKLNELNKKKKKKGGRKKGSVSKRTNKVIKHFNEGLNAREIGKELYPKLRYDLLKKVMKRDARNMENNFKENPHLFARTFDKTLFLQTLESKKESKKSL